MRARAPRGATVLNTDGKLWIGIRVRVHDVKSDIPLPTYAYIGGKETLPGGLPAEYYSGFRGCLRKVRVFRKRLDLIRGNGRRGGGGQLQLCGGGGQD